MHIGMKRPSFESWANPTWGNLLITLPWGIGILVAVFGWSADHIIAKRERTTIGVVTAHKASRSDRYLYTFSVNGEKLEGSSGADDRHNVGDQVTVFYDPIDPNMSVLLLEVYLLNRLEFWNVIDITKVRSLGWTIIPKWRVQVVRAEGWKFSSSQS